MCSGPTGPSPPPPPYFLPNTGCQKDLPQIIVCYTFRRPQDTLRFSNSPEGLTELREGVLLVVIVHYSKRTRIKISQGKKRMVQGPGEARHQLPWSFLVESHTQGLLAPAMMRDNTPGGITHQGSSPKPWCVEFWLGGQSCRHG